MTTGDQQDPRRDDALDPEDRDVVVDEDFVLIGRYLGGDMTEAERRDVERRAESSPEFWDKVGPLAGIFALAKPFDMDAFEEAFGPVRGSSAATPSAPRRRSRSWRAWLPGIANVAEAVLRVVWRILKWGFWTCFGLAAIGVALRNWKPVTTVESQFLLRVSHTDSAMIATSTAEFIEDQARGRAFVAGWGTLVQDSAAAGERRTLVFGDHSRAVVLPESRVAYRVPQTFEQRVASPTGQHVTVDGEVLFWTVSHWTFNTRFARIEVGAGAFAIRCIPKSPALQIGVGRGTAWVFPDGNKDSIRLQAGDYLTIPSTGGRRLTRDSTGYPLFGDTAVAAILRKMP